VTIGDSLVDIEFARGLGMTAILIDNTGPPRPDDELAQRLADLRFPSLAEAVCALLEKR
jgi:phosphoglycolate phosphatase-like HAD superfamily hydrolase